MLFAVSSLAVKRSAKSELFGDAVLLDVAA
jgi:hypothetical protein